MLALTRKPGESLRIGADVRITVVASSSGQVRLAIEAPDDVAIHREEVYERIAQVNVQAAQVGDEILDSYAASRPDAREGEPS